MTTPLTAAAVRDVLGALADPKRAVSSASFFKTGPGEYGEGDVFIGIAVPDQRKVAKTFRGIDATEIDALLDSEIHEHRLTALFLLRREYEAASVTEKPLWVERFYDAVDRGRVNNWDLVDSSAEYILGNWCVAQGDRQPLLDYASDNDLWRRRVGIVGSAAFTKVGDTSALLAVAPIVIDDRRDLIQKAFGWMLREMGKRADANALTRYLDEHAPAMGRTALSYALEHLTPEQRTRYRAKK